MKNCELDCYIEKFQHGDGEMFDTIYDETKKLVYLSIYPIVYDQFMIEDIMQDTYMKAIHSIDKYCLGSNFNAWIAKIARNTAINYYHKMKKEVPVDALEQEHLFKSNSNSSEGLLEHAFLILEGCEKEIITYRIIFDLSFKDIGFIMDMPLGNVYYLYQKALKKIKKW